MTLANVSVLFQFQPMKIGSVCKPANRPCNTIWRTSFAPCALACVLLKLNVMLSYPTPIPLDIFSWIVVAMRSRYCWAFWSYSVCDSFGSRGGRSIVASKTPIALTFSIQSLTFRITFLRIEACSNPAMAGGIG